MGEGMLFFTFLLIGEQISASIFGGFRKKSYLCTAIQKKWRFRLGVRTHASHAWNTGSIPVVATKTEREKHSLLSLCLTSKVGLQSTDYRVQITESRLQSPDYRVQITDGRGVVFSFDLT